MSGQAGSGGGGHVAVPVLRVGFVPGVTLTKWRRSWSERFPRLPLDVVEVAETDQHAALEHEQVDMCFVRLPLDSDRCHVIPLYEEVLVVVVPKDHPASLFDELTLADLSEEDVLEGFETGEAMDLVAGGAGVLFVPHSIARSHSRRDLVYRPVTDAEPTRVGLAWLRENPHEMIEEFVGIVRGRTVNSSRSPSRPAAPQPSAPRAREPRPAARTPKRGPGQRPGRRRGR